MMIHSFVTADLAAQRTRTLRAEADAHRLARLAARADPDPRPPRRWARLWGQRPPVCPAARPA